LLPARVDTTKHTVFERDRERRASEIEREENEISVNEGEQRNDLDVMMDGL
jgi:hypothetical protein